MQRLSPAETKLVLCVYNDFSLWRPPAELAASIRRRWPEMKVVHLPAYDRLAEEIADTHIHVGYALRPAQLRQARSLQWMHVTAAGVSQMLFPEFVASEVILTNARGVNAIPIGDHTLGAIIALARHFPSAWRYQAEHRWAQQQIWDESPRPRELGGQRLVLVGLGSIGKEIAVRARGFGMKITAVTRSGLDRDGLADEILAADGLDAAVARADFVVLAAPETPTTRRLMDARRLTLMKPSAFLINVARGALVDEEALVEALRTRRIAGAAIDVAEREPLAPDSPLWSLNNVIITPHVANLTESLWERQGAIMMENLERWFGGRELMNLVDKERGY